MIVYSKVSIVQGDGGDGKTTMILDISARLSVGIQPPALIDSELHYTDEKVEPVTTFYLTNEDEVADSSGSNAPEVMTTALHTAERWSIT